MIDSLCVVGGGTSGLVSALMLKHAYPELKVTVIESSQIGIIGVGEGSTEHWKKFIEHVGISVPELIRECGATFKIGIKFTDWHGDKTSYFHSISEQYGHHSKESGLPVTWIYMAGQNLDPLDTSWALSQQSRHVEPLHDILAQYHFDTFKLNDFLHKKCRERGINFVDTEVEQVILDDQGYVTELKDKQGNSHAYDFYIDSSGFRRIIGTALGTQWVDCTDQLPMNSAIAFPTGYTEDIPSYTEATALGSGWVWRIPTQERYGNGYVFCDSFINEDQAYAEVSKHYKDNLNISDELKIGRKVKFGAGYVKEFWIKNCVQVGLSGIFVEPLEASSIGTTIQQCFILTPSIFFYERGEDLTAKRYNDHMSKIAENIVDFIRLHYFTERSDTEFWRWCKNKIVKTEFNREYLDYFKKTFPNGYYFNVPLILFSHLNYAQVMHGLRMFDHTAIKEKYEKHLGKYTDLSKHNIADAKQTENLKVEVFTHREAINRLKERYDELTYKL